jgi:hypothetical protein
VFHAVPAIAHHGLNVPSNPAPGPGPIPAGLVEKQR